MGRPDLVAELGRPLRETGAALWSVCTDRSLRRVHLALAASMVGDWAYATAVTVWAFGVGGARAVGLYVTVRLLVTAVAAPLGTALADRISQRAVMVTSDLLRCGLVATAAGCLYAGTPAGPIFVLAVLAGLVGAPFRPAQMALMPSLVERPEELTASNATASTLESLAFFLGPALGAGIIATLDVEAAFTLNAVTFLVSALLVLGVHPRPGALARSGPLERRRHGLVGEVLAGFRLMRTDGDVRLVATLVCAQTVVSGASLVFLVLVAVELLGMPAHGVGLLESILGVGAILGGLVVMVRLSAATMGRDLWLGVMLWAVPPVLVAAAPHPATVVAAMLVIGVGNAFVDVNYATILQRVVPVETMSRVFGAVEGALIASMAVGSLLTPWLVDVLGLRWTLVVVGGSVALLVAGRLPRLVRLDRSLAPPRGLELLRATPIFAPVPHRLLDSLALRLTPLCVPAGVAVTTEGEEGDCFYVIESGCVEVTSGGRLLRTETVGEFFGEIALLRNVPRTATVTAVEDCVLLALGREDFLDAVTGTHAATAAAEEAVSGRLRV